MDILLYIVGLAFLPLMGLCIFSGLGDIIRELHAFYETRPPRRSAPSLFLSTPARSPSPLGGNL